MSALHILLNYRNLEEFYNLLKDERQYKPTTVAEKLRRMKIVIQYTKGTQTQRMK